MSVWRGVRGEPMEEVLSTTSAAQLTSSKLLFQVAPDDDYHFDNVVAVSDSVSSTTTYAYNNGNELTSLTFEGDTTSFTYDDWGRQVSKYLGTQTTDYTYAYGSKLTEVSSDFYDEGDVDYEYRGDGMRHKRTAGSDVTVYNWAAGWVSVSEENNSGTLQRTYVPHSPSAETSMTLAHVDGTTPGTGDYQFYMHDNLGSTRFLYDGSDNLDGELEYSPYGGAYHDSANEDVTLRFTGHTWDGVSELYSTPYRMYSPQQSRWLTRDPLGIVDGPNLYGYVVGNPIRHSDTLGLSFRDLLFCIGASAGCLGLCKFACACGAIPSPITPACWLACGLCLGASLAVLWECWDRVMGS